jgi:hypothetical protein
MPQQESSEQAQEQWDGQSTPDPPELRAAFSHLDESHGVDASAATSSSAVLWTFFPSASAESEARFRDRDDGHAFPLDRLGEYGRRADGGAQLLRHPLEEGAHGLLARPFGLSSHHVCRMHAFLLPVIRSEW